MLNDEYVWLELFKTVYPIKMSKVHSGTFNTSVEAVAATDCLLVEYRKRFPVSIDETKNSANEPITWANVNKQTPDTRY